MSWRKDKSGEPDSPRGYHHGNLREALIRAALELIATKGTAGFTFAEAARFAGVSPAAPYRHFRDRDELMASVALRGFEQFEASLTRAWGEAVPRPSPRWIGSAKRISTSLAMSQPSTRQCSKPAFPREPIPRCAKPASELSPCCAARPRRFAARCLRWAVRPASWWRCTSGPWRMAWRRYSDALTARNARCQCLRLNFWRRRCWSICAGSEPMRRGRESLGERNPIQAHVL